MTTIPIREFDPTTATELELKAVGYDLQKQLAVVRHGLEIIEQELERRHMAQPLEPDTDRETDPGRPKSPGNGPEE